MMYRLTKNREIRCFSIDDINYGFALDDIKIIKQEHIGPFFISTVFLCVDHRMSGDDNGPVLFETMVFCDGKDDDDLYCERTTSYDLAITQHEKVVALFTVKYAAMQILGGEAV